VPTYEGSILKTETEEWFPMLEAGRPGNSVTNVDKAELLLKDRILSLRDSLNMSLERVHQIVTMQLAMSRVCARLVPRDLSQEKKRKSVEVCQRNVTPDEQKLYFPSSINTCDEYWVKHYDPKSNSSLMFGNKYSPQSNKFGMASSTEK
jgi:hypothetical protein